MSLYETLYLISKKSGHFNPHIEQIIRKVNPHAMIYTTQTAQDITEQSASFAKKSGHKGIIYIAGGDGAVHEVVNSIYSTGCHFGVFPFGTGNDFARHIYNGKFPALEDLVHRSLNPILRPIDLIQINERLCVNVSSYGLDTIISEGGKEIALKNPKVKKFSYYLSALKHFSTPYEHEFTLSVDGVVQKTDWKGLLFVIGNGSSYGSGFKVLPTAKINDGFLNVLSVEKIPPFKILRLFKKFFTGNHLDVDVIHHYQARQIDVTFNHVEPGNIDGEFHPEKIVHAKILPQAIMLSDLSKTASK